MQRKGRGASCFVLGLTPAVSGGSGVQTMRTFGLVTGKPGARIGDRTGDNKPITSQE